MKITKLTTYRLAPRWMFLRVGTDEGVSGWGEAVIEGRARTVEAAVIELSEYVIGRDPSRINDLWQTLYRAGFYRGGPILMSEIAGIDQVLWDIKGKVIGAPVYELLGGLVRDGMKMYSWVGGDRPVDVIASIRKLQAIGFDTFKINKKDFEFHDGYMLPPQKPGLGVEIDEALVIERSKNAPDWHNPVWRHADGSVAEW